MAESSVVLSEVYLAGNYAWRDGGAIDVLSQAPFDLRIVDSTIAYNMAIEDGGGLHLNPTAELNLVLQHTSLESNYAERDGGGLAVSVTQEVDVNLLLRDVEVHGNTSWEDGGGLSVSGPTQDEFAELTGVLDVRITDSVLDENWSYGAAGALLLGGHAAEVALSNTTLTATETGDDTSCAVQVQMTADFMATTTDWGIGTTENTHCDVIDTLGQSVDLTATADILCTDGVCATE